MTQRGQVAIWRWQGQVLFIDSEFEERNSEVSSACITLAISFSLKIADPQRDGPWMKTKLICLVFESQRHYFHSQNFLEFLFVVVFWSTYFFQQIFLAPLLCVMLWAGFFCETRINTIQSTYTMTYPAYQHYTRHQGGHTNDLVSMRLSIWLGKQANVHVTTERCNK